ncbi:hypothetical protein LDG_7494 [Legionella drancourtii LLAP12]|uniref:Uncharacterized protein n=1 Tax=Legionella drancourtii LLAP12 TaxID=658187 RepID=G9EQE7_9GAMM|nr:hypothetical protein LDG_7494 [Legionella drancourtii LLAP12]
MDQKPKKYYYLVWSYHRFNERYSDVAERLLYRGILVSHETA